jgi:nucleolar pre-ribosomal-associated protein 1
MFCYSEALQIVKLYERSSPEGSEGDQVPANVAHHFLLAICTRPGTGVCFKERGWYPREADDDSKVDDGDEIVTKAGRIHNKILANVLKGLKVNEDSRQQELALKILSACPELVSRYAICNVHNMN